MLKLLLLLEPLWGSSWGPFEGPLGALLGTKRAREGVLGACLGQLGANLGQIWLKLARLGSICALWGPLGAPQRAPKRAKLG